jgi:hypothetical protein
MAIIAFFAIVLRNSTSAAGVQERPRGRPTALIGSWPFPMDILPHTNHRRNDTKLIIKLQGHLISPWAQKADVPGHDRLGVFMYLIVERSIDVVIAFNNVVARA